MFARSKKVMVVLLVCMFSTSIFSQNLWNRAWNQMYWRTSNMFRICLVYYSAVY